MLNSQGSVMLVWLAIIVPFGIFYAAVYGPEAALFCELFDAKVRYTGISFVYQFSGIFASGITPIIATALLKRRRPALADLPVRAVRGPGVGAVRMADRTRRSQARGPAGRGTDSWDRCSRGWKRDPA